MKHRHDAQRGITLVWIAAALVVAGIAIAVMVNSANRDKTWVTKINTQKRLEEVSQAIIKFQRNYHRLPCPAPINVNITNSSFGVEVTNCATASPLPSGTVRSTIGSERMMQGMLPVRTLGLPIEYHADEWQNRFTYAVIESLTDPYQFSSKDGVLTLQNRAGSNLMTDGAFVVLSHGADGKGAYSSRAGILGVTCTSALGIDQANCDGNGTFLQADFTPTKASSHYDDQVIMLKVDALSKNGNNPCTTTTAANIYWGTGCRAANINMVHGAVRTSIANVAGGYSGQTNITCDDGAYVASSSTCTP